MGNRALLINSHVFRHADLQITRRGSDWYYTVCAIMGVATLAFLAMALTRPKSHRLFHYIMATVTFISCISYFTMGSNLGQVPIQAEWQRHHSSQVRAAGTREIFYVRYIDWFITAPLLLLALLLTARVPWPTIFVTLLFSLIMVTCGLIGALVPTGFKWGFWVFAVASLLFILWQVLGTGGRYASALGGPVKKTFWACAGLLTLLWLLYPISWGVSEGGNIIHPDSEAIFYGILDIFSKVIFGALLLLGHRNIDPRYIGLGSREPGDIDREKDGVAGQHSSGANGPRIGYMGQGVPPRGA